MVDTYISRTSVEGGFQLAAAEPFGLIQPAQLAREDDELCVDGG